MKGTIVLPSKKEAGTVIGLTALFLDSRMYRITPGACVHGWALPPPLLRWQDNP
jgi:hypothetical protein